jgi:hypothetical protein
MERIWIMGPSNFWIDEACVIRIWIMDPSDFLDWG